MIDLIKDLIPHFICGFTLITVYGHSTRSRYTRLNGEKYLLILLMSGILGHFVYTAFLFLWKLSPFVFIPSSELRILITYSVYALIGAFFGYLFAQKKFRHRFKEESEKFIVESDQATTGLLEKDLVKALNKVSNLFILELRTRKVYIGLITQADIQDDMPCEEKIIKFYPLISGYRSPTEEKIHYNTFYLTTDQTESLFKVEGKDFSVELKSFLEDIPPVAIFQKEIVTYRVWDQKLMAKFYFSHPEVPTVGPVAG